MVLFPGYGNFAGMLGWTEANQYEREMAHAEQDQAAVYARYADMDLAALQSDPEAMATAGRLFRQNCAMCHGSDGRGAPGFPNLADESWQWGGTQQDILNTLANGRTAAMPPLAAALGDKGVQEVVAYVRQQAGLEADPAQAAAGQTVFQTICMACHGMDGTGNPALGAPNLTDDVWLYGSDPDDIEFAVRNGRGGQMPAFGGKLSEERRKLLAAYVESLSGS
jgi:cytochrome c oxidase cbb3-type subunit 3